MIISNIMIMYKQLQPYSLTQDRYWSVKVHKKLRNDNHSKEGNTGSQVCLHSP